MVDLRFIGILFSTFEVSLRQLLKKQSKYFYDELNMCVMWHTYRMWIVCSYQNEQDVTL